MNNDRWKIRRVTDKSPTAKVEMYIPQDIYDVTFARDVLEAILAFLAEDDT